MSGPLLDLNLAARPFRNNTLPWIAHGVAIVGLVSLSWWNFSTHTYYRAELDDLAKTVGSIDSQMRELNKRESAAQRAAKQHDVTELAVQAHKANQVIQRKALSWTRLFNEMEQVLPYHVKMLSIRPEFVSTGRRAGSRSRVPEGAVPVNVNGVAKTLRDLLEFEQNLLADARFDDVDPHRYNNENNQVFFELKFLYFPQVGYEQEQATAAAEAAGETGDTGADSDAAGPGAAG